MAGWAAGKIHPNKKGGKGGNPTLQNGMKAEKMRGRLYSATWGKSTHGMLKRKRRHLLKSKNKRERVRKWAKGRAARILGPREEEEEEIKEEGERK